MIAGSLMLVRDRDAGGWVLVCKRCGLFMGGCSDGLESQLEGARLRLELAHMEDCPGAFRAGSVSVPDEPF